MTITIIFKIIKPLKLVEISPINQGSSLVGPILGESFPIQMYAYLANGQPFKLWGITYLVGKIKFKLFFQGPLAK